MNSWSSPLGGSIKTATRFETPLCTKSAASSAPAPPGSRDKRMRSAGATGSSFTTSVHPAARRTGSRRERMATITKRGQRERRQDQTVSAPASHAEASRCVLSMPRIRAIRPWPIIAVATMIQSDRGGRAWLLPFRG